MDAVDMTDVPRVRTDSEIQQWLVDRIAARLQMPPDQVSVEDPIISLGLDSMQSVVLIGELEDWLGCRFTANPLVEHPNIEALSKFLAERTTTDSALPA
ncbi:MAG: acyl carrier protein [Planctomycetaceae bacterium]|nr:acyl carrier protein [Planctomycetaceae bacterium]